MTLQLEFESEYLAAIVESAGDAIIGKNLDGIITVWNGEAERVFGYAAQDIVGQSILLLIPEDRREEERQLMERIKQGERVPRFDTVRRKEDGHEIDVSISIAPIRDRSGRVIGASKTVHDISERKRQDESFRLVVEASPTALVIVAVNGRIRLVNSQTETLFGYTRKELIGEAIEMLIPDRYRAGHGKLRDGFLSNPSARAMGSGRDLFGLRKDGTEIPIEIGLNPVQTHEGTIILTSIIDISDRKRVERLLVRQRDELAKSATELKATLARLRAVMNNASMFLWAIDVNGIVTDLEGRLLNEPGVTDQVSVGHAIFETYANTPKIAEFSRRALQSESFHEQVEINGLTVEMWWTPVFDEAGHFSGTICVGVDVSERVRLEAHLRQAQKMEAIGRLAGGVAHDFNNHLMVISSFATLAIERLHDTPDIRQDVEQIHQAAQSAAHLTSQLLAFSRRQIVQPRLLDLGAEVTRIESMVRRLIGENIHLTTNLPNDLARVKADPGQIEQIVMNLVVNARDAMPQGGRITIEGDNVELNETVMESGSGGVSGRYVRLAVTDTGIGMDEETRGSIFEPFFTTKELGKGTGLGLATVYGLVRQNGGLIMVDSEPGRGASFKIYLPAMVGEIVPKPAPTESDQSLAGGETILVVEDQHGVLDVIGRMLSFHGYKVLSAASGIEAAKISVEYSGVIDLVISDLIMPDIAGHKLTAKLHADRPAMRVLYMSGHTDDTVIRLGIANSGFPFLQKPFSSQALLKKVREMLDSPLDSL
jgi:PAS domain S-box-containing protein